MGGTLRPTRPARATVWPTGYRHGMPEHLVIDVDGHVFEANPRRLFGWD